MSPPCPANPGAVVAWWRGQDLALAVVAAEEKQRVTLIGSGGREDRVPPARLAFEIERAGPPPGRRPDERKPVSDRVARIEERIRAMAATVDVGVLWELAREPANLLSERALADLALGASSGEACAALIRALLDDGLHFVRKQDGWEPRAAEAVREIRQQREREAHRATEREAARLALVAAAAGAAFVPTGNPYETRYLAALEDVAVHAADASTAAIETAREVLEAVGLRYDRLHEGAFRLLRRSGRFDSDDANLEILRYRLRTEFPPEVVEAASGAARRVPAGETREDLTDLEIVTVDSAHTREIDDGLSLERLDRGRRRVGIHIADPCAFVAPGDPVDAEAFARATSHYFPERRIAMIPEPISEEASSLVAGAARSALTFLVDLDAEGAISDFRVTRSTIRVRERLDYDAVDRILESSDGIWAGFFRDLAAAATTREACRLASGAIRIQNDEVEVHVKADGSLVLERRDTGSPAHRIVSEAMILAGAVAARFCAERKIAAIHRRQASPSGDVGSLRAAVQDPVAARQLRRSLKRAEAGLQPGPHAALGLPAYAQATSPLRRFQDLANHRQILSAIDPSVPAYSTEALQRIAATTERTEAEGRRAERAMDRYWLLRYLEHNADVSLDAVVVETDPRPVVLLEATQLEETAPALTGVALGERLRIRIERVNARADVLILRPL